MRPLTLVNADLKILIAAMTFLALLVVVLVPDGCIDLSPFGCDWYPVPIPESRPMLA